MVAYQNSLCYNDVKNKSKGGKNMRKHYIDNIRWMTVVLVVIYHVIYMYNGVVEGGVIGPFREVQYQDAVQYVLYPWFMVLLFLVSGMCARYYLEKHTDREFVRSRTRKLLVPSTIGLFVFQWLQGWLNMAISNAFDTMPQQMPGVIRYVIMVVSGTGVLWYIQVLWVVSMLLPVVRKMEKDRFYNICGKVNILGLILLVIPVWGAAQILNTPVICVYRFGIYGCCFLLGYYVFSHEEVTDRLKKWCIPFAVTAIVLAVCYVVVYFGENYAEKPVVNSPLSIAYAWCACLAILGCMKRWGDHTCRFFKFMSTKNFGLYVFHYLALSAMAYFLKECTPVTGFFAYLLSAVAAFGGGLLLYEIISRIPFLNWCVLGIKKEKKHV